MLTYIDRALDEAIRAAGRQREKESENVDLHKENTELENATTLLRNQLAEKDQKIVELDEENRVCCREIEALTAQVTGIHSSTSWRITGPIRSVKNTCASLQLSISNKRKHSNEF